MRFLVVLRSLFFSRRFSRPVAFPCSFRLFLLAFCPSLLLVLGRVRHSRLQPDSGAASGLVLDLIQLKENESGLLEDTDRRTRGPSCKTNVRGDRRECTQQTCSRRVVENHFEGTAEAKPSRLATPNEQRRRTGEDAFHKRHAKAIRLSSEDSVCCMGRVLREVHDPFKSETPLRQESLK